MNKKAKSHERLTEIRAILRTAMLQTDELWAGLPDEPEVDRLVLDAALELKNSIKLYVAAAELMDKQRWNKSI